MLIRDQQPTEFWLDVYPIAEVFDTPELIQNLAEYAGKPDRIRSEPLPSSSKSKESLLFNVFPKSLGPTAAYIGVLAVGAWFISGFVWKFLRPDSTDKAHKE
jgi:hypothetical protein